MRLEIVRGSVTVAAMRSHFWVRPGEQQECIGCHEPRGRAPENRLILALERDPAEVSP